MEHITEIHRKSNNSIVENEQEQPAIFAQRFLRSCCLLNFIACRVLGDKKRAPVAVQNCWRTASCNPPHFEHEGAFRSWLVRVLIDEALVILRESHRESHAAAAIAKAASLSDGTVELGLG